jgi:hypothetical protein
MILKNLGLVPMLKALRGPEDKRNPYFKIRKKAITERWGITGVQRFIERGREMEDMAERTTNFEGVPYWGKSEYRAAVRAEAFANFLDREVKDVVLTDEDVAGFVSWEPSPPELA